MLQDVTGTDADVYYGFLEACLRHKSEMVVFEAAKYVCSNNSHSLYSRLVLQKYRDVVWCWFQNFALFHDGVATSSFFSQNCFAIWCCESFKLDSSKESCDSSTVQRRTGEPCRRWQQINFDSSCHDTASNWKWRFGRSSHVASFITLHWTPGKQTICGHDNFLTTEVGWI